MYTFFHRGVDVSVSSATKKGITLVFITIKGLVIILQILTRLEHFRCSKQVVERSSYSSSRQGSTFRLSFLIPPHKHHFLMRKRNRLRLYCWALHLMCSWFRFSIPYKSLWCHHSHTQPHRHHYLRQKPRRLHHMPVRLSKVSYAGHSSKALEYNYCQLSLFLLHRRHFLIRQ